MFHNALDIAPTISVLRDGRGQRDRAGGRGRGKGQGEWAGGRSKGKGVGAGGADLRVIALTIASVILILIHYLIKLKITNC